MGCDCVLPSAERQHPETRTKTMARGRRSTVEVVPSARRLIGSLRDIGYDTPEAVADLIDNSIVARATRVDVTLHFDGAASSIRISDDGTGMTGGTLTEAMKYGSERDYDDDDLGKFGLGLKTASMSQCRRLSVASRTSKSVARIEARQLDLDYVERTDSWRVFLLGAAERSAALCDPLKQHRGTVVLWESLDRILNYRNPGSEWARSKLLALGERLDLHLGMVFHRFISGEVPRRRKLRIVINGTVVEPWDPFSRAERHTNELKAHDFEIHTANGSGIVRLEPFVLPPKDRFSDDAAHRRASGPNSWNRQQGFYVYRADRLIQSGGWSRMRTQDEHTKLARVALLFPPDLDAAFGINVAKMRVSLPPELKEQIKPTLDQVIKRAQAAYREKPDGGARPLGRGGGRTSPQTGLAATDAATEGSDGRAAGREARGTFSGMSDSGVESGSNVGFSSEVRRSALQAAATAAEESEALEKIVRALKDQAPEVARDIGW